MVRRMTMSPHFAGICLLESRLIPPDHTCKKYAKPCGLSSRLVHLYYLITARTRWRGDVEKDIPLQENKFPFATGKTMYVCMQFSHT